MSVELVLFLLAAAALVLILLFSAALVFICLVEVWQDTRRYSSAVSGLQARDFARMQMRQAFLKAHPDAVLPPFEMSTPYGL